MQCNKSLIMDAPSFPMIFVMSYHIHGGNGGGGAHTLEVLLVPSMLVVSGQFTGAQC